MAAFDHGLAITVIVVSSAFAFAMAMLIALLLVRRLILERHAAATHARGIVLSRELMTATGMDNAPRFMAAGTGERMRAMTRVLQLLRGEDHDRLLILAKAAHVYDHALADVTQTQPARRVDALRILENFPAGDCIDALRARMGSDPVMAVRLEAAAALARCGALPEPLTVIHMLDLKHQPLTRLHGALFRSIATRDTATLARLVDDPRYSWVRAVLVEALGWSEDYRTLYLLERHAIDDDPEVRCAALKAARKLGHPGDKRWIVSRLVDPVEAVRIQAVRACGELGVREAVPILIALLNSPSWWIAMRARQALDQLRPDQPVGPEPDGVMQPVADRPS